jgi:quercetin dioxygenase-like cupin family protein
MERTEMRIITSAGLVIALVGGAATAEARANSQAQQPELKWGPAPAVFPAGAQMAVLQGNPGAAEPFTVRLRFPSGYKIAPHTHPTDENITVITGTFRVGMGKTFDARTMTTLPAGGFVIAPANMAHYAAAQGVTVVQIHSMGPFALTYVNPADLPKAGTAK